MWSQPMIQPQTGDILCNFKNRFPNAVLLQLFECIYLIFNLIHDKTTCSQPLIQNEEGKDI